MSTNDEQGTTPIIDRATVLGTECKLSALPLEFQHALKFAEAHELVVLLGYVEDEGKAYLMTVPLDEPAA